jgi:hypothetical protein
MYKFVCVLTHLNSVLCTSKEKTGFCTYHVILHILPPLGETFGFLHAVAICASGMVLYGEQRKSNPIALLAITIPPSYWTDHPAINKTETASCTSTIITV